MNILLFITVLVISFIVVRIGAIAFQLTGLEWSVAKFQALSCFTSTGFTTREAELVTGHPQRRRIATALIVLGNAGLVTLVATVASALSAQQAVWARLSESILPVTVPSILVPWVNLALIVIAVYVVYRVFTNRGILKRITEALRKRIVKREIFQPVSFEELLHVTGGYGVSRIEICDNSRVLNKTLLESGLRKSDITVLAITRTDTTLPNPSADTKILLGDELICFGRLENIRDTVCSTI